MRGESGECGEDVPIELLIGRMWGGKVGDNFPIELDSGESGVSRVKHGVKKQGHSRGYFNYSI